MQAAFRARLRSKLQNLHHHSTEGAGYAPRIASTTTTPVRLRRTCLASIVALGVGLFSIDASAQANEAEPDASANSEPTEAASTAEPAPAPPKKQYTRKRRGEVFSDIYIGVSRTSDAEVTVDGVVQEASLLCGAQCSNTLSPIGGLRVGWFAHKYPWLGVSGDLSYFRQSWGIQSPYVVNVIPISALAMFRAPLVRSAEHPNGRAQPYLAVGPSLIISPAKIASGLAATGTARISKDRAVSAGIDGRVGMRLIASSWISVVLEGRVTYFKPTWQLEGRRVETSVTTFHFIIGLGIHY